MSIPNFDPNDPLMAVPLSDFFSWVKARYPDSGKSLALLRNSLNADGLKYVGELTVIYPNAYMRIPNIGRTSVRLLESCLGKIGIDMPKIACQPYGGGGYPVLPAEALAALDERRIQHTAAAWQVLDAAAAGSTERVRFSAAQTGEDVKLSALPGVVAEMSAMVITGAKSGRVVLVRTQEGQEPVTITISATRGLPPQADGRPKRGLGEG